MDFQNNDLAEWFPSPGNDSNNSRNEDLVYLLSTLLEQAKYLTLNIMNSSERTKLKRSKVKSMFDAYDSAVNTLLEEVGNEKVPIDYEDDNDVVRQVLKWLYYGLDKDRKNIGLVLRPYLSKLFTVSHENSWHMSEWRRRQEKDEMSALGKFCSLVIEGQISIKDGIIDAYQKGKTTPQFN
jgi:hypothetical protein